MTYPSVEVAELAVSKGLVGGPFGSSLVNRDYTESGIPVIRGANMSHGKFLAGEFAYVSEEKADQDLARNQARAGDLVFTQRGTLGQVAVVPNGEFDRYVVSQSQMRLRVDPTLAHPDFVYYACTSASFLKQIDDHAIATGVPHINLGILGRLSVPLPPVAEQRAIVEVLGALDDKIAANRKLISKVREVAHTEFKLSTLESSVDVQLGDVAEFHNKRRAPLSANQRESMVGQIPYYGATGVFDHVDQALFDEILLLVGEDGSVVTDDGHPITQYIWGPAWVNNHAHVLTGRDISTELLALAVEQAQVAALITGAVQPKLSMGNLKKLELVVPGEGVGGRLDAKIQPMFEVVRSLTEESSTLTETRDALLPRLMSGELRVRDAEKSVEAVL